MMTRFFRPLIAPVLVTLCAWPAFAETPVFRLIPQWTPQSQFAGYYIAAEKGFYAARGIEVEVLKGGPKRDPGEWLQSGKADFATMFLTGALADLDHGLPLVHLGQVVNQSNQILVAWRDQGIQEIGDLERKRVSIWAGCFRPAYAALFQSQKVVPEILTQYYSVNLFLLGGVAACSAMHYNEYHVIYQAGVNYEELTAFFLRDFGMGFPEDGLYCLEKTYAEHPEACQAFVEASLEGWQYANEHRGEALSIVMHHVGRAHVPTNRLHMKWMLDTILPTIVPGPDASWEPGVLDETRYDETVNLLRTHGQIQSAPSFAAFRGEEVRRAP